MANERTYPCLPCADIDVSIAFYESIGFTQDVPADPPEPLRGRRSRGHAHPSLRHRRLRAADSYGTPSWWCRTLTASIATFAAGLRTAYGKLPVAGIPRILRPRKKYGTVRGFSVVDPGGNWLRISKLGETEQEDSAEKA